MNQPPSHEAGRQARDDHLLRQLRQASDPVPPEVTEAAKAAFARRTPPATELPSVLDVRARRSSPDAGVRNEIERLDFGDDQSLVRLEVETELVDRVVALRCAVRTNEVQPIAVIAESNDAQHPLAELAAGLYGASGLPAGPLRIRVEFDDRPERSVVTSWFTA